MIYEYTYCIFIEDTHTTVSLLLQQYYESIIHNSDLLNLIPCEIDIKSTPFFDITILTYEIDLPPSVKKFESNLLDNEDSTILYITDTIPNLPSSHQLPTQAKRNVWIIANNGEEPIKAQGALDELNHHQNPCGKSKFKISICRRNIY